MHRIPYGKKSGPEKNKPVVFVQHGLLSSSADWIIAGPDMALGTFNQMVFNCWISYQIKIMMFL